MVLPAPGQSLDLPIVHMRGPLQRSLIIHFLKISDTYMMKYEEIHPYLPTLMPFLSLPNQYLSQIHILILKKKSNDSLSQYALDLSSGYRITLWWSIDNQPVVTHTKRNDPQLSTSTPSMYWIHAGIFNWFDGQELTSDESSWDQCYVMSRRQYFTALIRIL